MATLTLTQTIVFEDEQPIRSAVSDESVARLLVNLDVAHRGEASTVAGTIATLLEYAERDGEDARGVLKQAILVAFRRRNHQKSQADGEGSGERALFVEILLAIAALQKFDDLVLSVLPLVPVYGSWRDLLVLGEEFLLRSSSGDVAEQPLVESVCRLFAQQLLDDEAALAAEERRATAPSGAEADPAATPRRPFTPTNASKYAPHESRHDSAKTERKRKRDEEPAAESTPEDGGRGGGRGGRGGRGRGRGGRGGRGEIRSRPQRSITTAAGAELWTAAEEALKKHRANKAMALRVAHLLHERRGVSEDATTGTAVAEGANALLAAYRRLRAKLNGVLAARGHLIEPLLVAKDAKAIRFGAANKGALAKYTKAINRDPVAAKRWKAAMLRNPSAVPDIDSLVQAVAQCVEEVGAGAAADEPLLLTLRARKAVTYLRTRLEELQREAHELQRSAASEGAELEQTPPVRQLVVVDSCVATTETSRLTLLLSAALLSLAQQSRFFVLDGHVVETPDEAADLARWLLDTAAHVFATSAVDDADENLARIRQSLTLALAEHATRHAAEAGDVAVVDVVCLCVHFCVYDERSDAFHAALQALQAADTRPTLRTFRVHRLRVGRGATGEEDVPFEPRAASMRRRELPTDAATMTADVLFLVDFTGSMGPWMASVKRELVALISEIQVSTRLRNVRVALVGYRDYSDRERVVTVDFRDACDVGDVVDQIQRQQADGGADAPEDMLSGLVAARDLDWRGDLRFCVVITDAPAHGFSAGHGDNYPSGRCPDQRAATYPSLEQCVEHLAVQLEVDTFFCLLGGASVSKTLEALRQPYKDRFGGAGFGTVTMASADSSFRTQLVEQLSTAVVGSVVTKDLAGLQSADGLTLSSLALTLLASLRQSLHLDAIDLSVKPLGEVDDAVAPSAERATTPPEAAVEHEGPAAEGPAEVATASAEGAEPTAVLAPASLVDEIAVARRAEKNKAKELSATRESDWQRLQRDLRAAMLHPVRLALGLPLHLAPGAKDSDGLSSLSAVAAEALARAGLTVAQLEEQHFPEQIVRVYRDHLAAKLAAL